MTEFIPAAAQLLLSVLFGVALFFGWRRIAGPPGPMFWLVTIGLLGRALTGQLLFWLSYLRLPFARSLQAGDGFWFFAIDAIYYFDRAADAARGGVDAIVFLNRTEASVFYIQTLAVFAYLFGTSPAVALLLNTAAYLAICAIVLHLAPPEAGRSRTAAIAALSLTPSLVLWSLQPLKDIYFLFLVALFVFACDLWQRLAAGSGGEPRAALRRVAAALLMVLVLYGVSGIRWYFGMALIAASGLFLLLTAIRAPRRRAQLASSAGILLLMLVAFRAGGGPYIPDPIRRALAFDREAVTYAARAPKFVVSTVEGARRAFETAAGATAIGAGDAMIEKEKKIAEQEKKKEQPQTAPAVTPGTTERPTAVASAKSEKRKRPAAGETRESVQQQAEKGEPTEEQLQNEEQRQTEPAATTTRTAGAAAPAPTAAAAKDATPKAAPQVAAKTPRTAPQGTSKPAAQQPSATTASEASKAAAESKQKPQQPSQAERAAETKVAEATKKKKDAPARTATAKKESPARAAAKPPAPVATKPAATPVTPAPTPAAPPTTAVAKSQPAPAAKPAGADEPTDPSQAITLPKSPVARFISGAAAVVLPKSVAEALGLFRVGGGRGLWLFVEIDTIIFDVILLYALYCIATRFRTAVRTPSFWLIVAMMVLVGAPLMYTVSNFGTLFRHRNMIYIGLVFLPLTIAAVTTRRPPEQQQPTQTQSA